MWHMECGHGIIGLNQNLISPIKLQCNLNFLIRNDWLTLNKYMLVVCNQQVVVPFGWR